MAFKDLFSAGAAAYARFRPSYPPALYAWLAETAARRELAIDVGTGNGQAAVALAERFDRVLALDPSLAQLANATAHPRVEYRHAPAEATGAPAGCADLITAGQAFHWFRHQAFFGEVRRVARPGGGALLAVWCYALTRITPEIDAVVDELYQDYLGRYWEPERRLVESFYRQVDVPFDELAAPAFDMRSVWRLEHLVGYLGTWSPLKRYIDAHGTNPIEEIAPRLVRAWGEVPEREVRWPLGVRAFRLQDRNGVGHGVEQTSAVS
jgi:SAM-dependent methyltransferase